MSLSHAVMASNCEKFGVAIPPAALDAAALVAEVEAAHGAETAKAKPDKASLAKGNVLQLVDDLLGFDSRRAARLDVLAQLKGVATSRLDEVWWRETPGLIESFRPAYDDAAERFGTALAELGDDVSADAAIRAGTGKSYEALHAAASELSALRDIRRDLAILDGIPPVNPDSLFHWSCVAVLDDADALFRSIPVRTSGLPNGSAAWWVAVSRIEGLALRWANKSEAQQRHEATLRRPRKPDPVAVESVRAGDARPTAGIRTPGPPAGVRA